MLEDGLGSALLVSARQYASQPALWAGEEMLSYRTFFERAGALAALLADRGIPPGERVAILSYRSSAAYVGVLAALLAGCTYVPLNTRFPPERNMAILRGSGARALVLDNRVAEELDGLLGEIDPSIVAVTPDAAAGAQTTIDLLRPAAGGMRLEDIQPIRVEPDQPCYLLFTSGTTGAPKGVPITHGNLGSYLPAIHKLVPIGPSDRVLQCVDLTFDLSVHDMFLTWLNGGTLYSAPENSSIFAPRLIARHELTACLLVPSTAARALQEGLLGPGKMPTLRYSLFAGEALPVSIVEAWRSSAPASAVFNLYGPTEGTIHTSWYKIDPSRELKMPVVPIGWPVGDQRMELFDAGKPVPAGETGEIYLTGPQMTPGYWRAPALDAEKFTEIDGTRWYRTGDLGRYVDEFGIIFGGRADRQVKIRGYRVELQEIEGALRKASGSEQVAVIAWPLTAEGIAEGCVAFVVGPQRDMAAIRRLCREALPVYMVPSEVFAVDELPLNANGKTDYKALYRHQALPAAG
ncbi:MAG: amino acid adenylation domain-containing protein [Reyranella sp.]|nr:amino acid adenylation domain-containing protein [Reyranella sp.]